MEPKQWIEREGNAALEAELVRDMGISPLMARLLVNRKIGSAEDIRLFLHGTMEDLCDPHLIKDMKVAVDRIGEAVRMGERIVIYGDYDVDGITGAALLYKALKMLGAAADHFVPDRLCDGYGISENAVNRLSNYDLMISVDCGISDFSAIQRAGELGLDVIVTDHHEIPSALPPALAVLDPKREDCPYPFPLLSGVGVAYKLAVVLLEALGRVPEEAKVWLELVAMGTVADIVPLLGENRILVKEGLLHLRDTANTGLRALKAVSSLKSDNVGVYEVGYLLAPRLNAAGRMGKADLAFALITSDDVVQCAAIARELDSLNNQRKKVEKKILDDARALLKKEYNGEKAVVLASGGWHPGVTGIVASKLKEEVNRPVILVSWEDNNKGKGTARSIPGFPVTSALGRCKDLLIAYGGHNAAAGFSIRRECWDAFRMSFLKLAEEEITQEDLAKKLFFDQEIDLDSYDAYDIIEEVEQLSPFGAHNPEPVFFSGNLKVVGVPGIVGNNHLKIVLQSGLQKFDAIGFNMGGLLPLFDTSFRQAGGTVNAAFALRKNSWRGKESIQLHLRDLTLH